MDCIVLLCYGLLLLILHVLSIDFALLYFVINSRWITKIVGCFKGFCTVNRLINFPKKNYRHFSNCMFLEASQCRCLKETICKVMISKLYISAKHPTFFHSPSSFLQVLSLLFCSSHFDNTIGNESLVFSSTVSLFYEGIKIIGILISCIIKQ